jgi:hypothetical protein
MASILGANKTRYFILNVSLSNYEQRDAQVANATAEEQQPNHILARGCRLVNLRQSVDSICSRTYLSIM